MSVARGQPITQSDMDALAVLANAKLAPARPYFFPPIGAVNPPRNLAGAAIVDDSGEFRDGDTELVRLYAYKTIGGQRVYSQPAQGFVKVVNADPSAWHLIRWTWDAPVGGAEGYAAVWVNDGPLPWNDRLFNNYWRPGVTSPLDDMGFGWHQFGPVLGELPPERPWLQELWRIRGDLNSRGKIFTNEPLVANDDWLVSGPHVVAVGDALFGSLIRGGLTGGTDAKPFLCFKDVEFYFAWPHDPLLDVTYRDGFLLGTSACPTVSSSLLGILSPPTFGSARLRFNVVFSSTLTATVRWDAYWRVGSPPASPPDISTVTHSATPSTGVTWAISGTGANWSIIATINRSVSGSETIDISVSAPAGYWFTGGFPADFSQTSVAHYIEGFLWVYGGTITIDNARVIHPSDVNGYKIHTPNVSDPVSFARYGTPDGEQYFSRGWRAFKIADGSPVNGVWKAKTLPQFALHTYLDVDLPNYQIGYEYVSTRDASLYEPSDTVNPVNPPVQNRSARWPVFRRQDFGTWRKDYPPGSAGIIPYWGQGVDPFHRFSEAKNITVEPDGIAYFLGFLGGETRLWILDLFDTTLPIYLSRTTTPPPDPSDPSTYEFTQVGGFTYPDDFPAPLRPLYLSNGWVIAVHNNTARPVTFNFRQTVFINGPGGYYPGDEPIFFASDWGNPYTPKYERYSYNFMPGTTTDVFVYGSSQPIPASGYCVFEIIATRPPRKNANGILVPDPDWTPATIPFGRMRGAKYDSPGIWEQFDTITIPANQASARKPVFLPVLSGAPLAFGPATNPGALAINALTPSSTTGSAGIGLGSPKGTITIEAAITAGQVRFHLFYSPSNSEFYDSGWLDPGTYHLRIQYDLATNTGTYLVYARNSGAFHADVNFEIWMDVHAFASFQPGLNVDFVPPHDTDTPHQGTFSGRPHLRGGGDNGYFSCAAFYNFPYGADFPNAVLFPICADLYNDLEALLNVLPDPP